MSLSLSLYLSPSLFSACLFLSLSVFLPLFFSLSHERNTGFHLVISKKNFPYTYYGNILRTKTFENFVNMHPHVCIYIHKFVLPHSLSLKNHLQECCCRLTSTRSCLSAIDPIQRILNGGYMSSVT